MEHSMFIRKNRYKLNKVTVCSENLLDALREANILHDSDVSVLSAVEDGIRRGLNLWKLIEQKKICVSTLSQIFDDQNQQHVVNILSTIVPVQKGYTFLDDLKPFPVSVIRPTEHTVKDDDDYNLVPDVIGLALIINVTEYDSISMNRRGAEQDTIYMSELWGQLGYRVTKYEGRYTSEEVSQMVKIFCKKFERFKFFQSCVVFIGCHGRQGKLIFSDDSSLDLYEDILLKFNDDHLRSKPKIFVIQSCDNVLQVKTVSNQETISNTTVCISSFRDVYLGSYFVYMLTDVLMRESYRSNFDKMLKEASRNLYQVLEPQKVDESYPHYHYFDMKTLYFNVDPTGLPQNTDDVNVL